MSQLEVDKIIPQSGTTLTIGDSGDTISFADGATLAIDTNTLAIDSTNNRVGIGTSSPSTTLHLAQSVPQIRLEDTDTGAYGTISGQSTAGSLFIRADDGNTVANSVLGFFVDNSQKMTIDSSGNVGIGTSSPDSLLHVYSSSPKIIIQDGGTHGTNSAPRLEFKDGSSIQGFVDFADDGTMRVNQLKAYPLTLRTNNVERMRITSSGDVGIGTSSPNRMLTLENGDIQIHETSTGDPLLNFSVGGTQASPTQSWSLRIDNSDVDKFQLIDVTDSRIVLTADGDGNVGIGTSSPPSYGSTFTVVQASNTGSGIIQANNSTNSVISEIESEGTRGAVGTRTNHDFVIKTNQTERMRITSSGNVLVGTTNTDPAFNNVVGQSFAGTGQIQVTRDGGTGLLVNRKTSDGELVSFRKDGATVGSIGAILGDIFINTGSTGLRFYDVTSQVIPVNGSGANRDNAIGLGNAAIRFDDAFIVNGVTTGSDRNEKQQIALLTDAEINVAKRISQGFKTYKWNSAVEEKGDNARTHTGVIAQEVQQAFSDEGLDASNYGMFMSDTWYEKEIYVDAVAEELDEEGNIIVEGKDAYTYIDTKEEPTEGYTEKTRLGIRYPELLSFVSSAFEQRLTDIETRLTALET